MYATARFDHRKDANLHGRRERGPGFAHRRKCGVRLDHRHILGHTPTVFPDGTRVFSGLEIRCRVIGCGFESRALRFVFDGYGECSSIEPTPFSLVTASFGALFPSLRCLRE